VSDETHLIVDGERRGPLAYRGKEDCDSAICTRRTWMEDGHLRWDTTCYGWHCSYCDAPTSYQGHRCDAAQAILGDAL
jgi:hypothetical protein